MRSSDGPQNIEISGVTLGKRVVELSQMATVTSSAESIGRTGNDLGKSVVIKGELSGSEDMTLRGQMEGTISLPAHTLTVGPQAEVQADISAKSVVVMGAVRGKVSAGERLEILATGSVTGDVTSPRLVIAEGGSLRGKVEMAR
jgi:cytoskeletal protein CcmA (bactofilin family)